MRYAISVIETMPVDVLVELNAHIIPGWTVQNSSSVLALIFALPDCAVQERVVPLVEPTPKTIQPWTSETTRT
jgi:hypothetical protein